jgi:predicted O-linked N-acetylglucosamine transferase (SPINDLY family)
MGLFNTGRYVELENKALLLIKQYPDSGFVGMGFGLSLQMQGKDALHALQKTAELMPGDPAAHNNLANTLRERGQLEAAVASCRRALKINPNFAEAHSNLGLALLALGQPELAVASFRRAIELKPNFAEVHSNLGYALTELRQFDKAVTSCRKAVSLKPDLADAHANLGNALKELGQLDAAQASYRRALEIAPNYAQVHNNLGAVLQILNQTDAAMASYRRALEINPNFADAHNNMSGALLALKKYDEAIASCRRALEINPEYAEAHNSMGNILLSLGQPDVALTSCRRALELKPKYAEAQNNMGIALKELGQIDAALASFRRALELKPDFAEAYSNLAIVQQEIGQLHASLASCRHALELKPDYADAYNNLGIAQKELGQLDAAMSSYLRALELKPEFAEAYSNLGNVQRDLGQLDDALDSCLHALHLKPDFLGAYDILLFTLNYMHHTPEYCLEEAQKYGRMVGGKVASQFTDWQSADHPQRLRVGLVSGDLHNHPVGYFLEGILSQIDPARIELIAYSTSHITSALTTRIKPYFSAWKPLFGSDDEAARLIHNDGVHVLLDLSGHTGKNRLPVFAWKPAPVQASWLGYFATTGVPEMDYYIADEVSVPESQRKNFSETVWYLPDTRLCFTAPDVDIPVAPLPALKNGHITFGCFQNLAKVGDDVLTVWGKVFEVLPDARLRWQCKQLGDPAVKAQIVERLQRHGIDPSRVVMHGTTSREAYLAAHGEVDVILDTFPFPGGTTTCEALWMGVPTLTLAGNTLLERQGASLLTAAGLADWVSTSAEDYIAKAVTLANDTPKLVTLRSGLREQTKASPLYDAPRFARNLEDALWGMWQTWVQRNAIAQTHASGRVS